MWMLIYKWFELVWMGDYFLLWKMLLEGESIIMCDSSEEEIFWLEMMLNCVLYILIEFLVEWCFLLVEKIK